MTLDTVMRAWSTKTKAALRRLQGWVDTTTSLPGSAHPDRIDWLRAVPFIAMHLGCLAVWWVGTSTIAVVIAASLYVIRMFAITAFYHRCFSHRAFRASRVVQFVFAVIGASSAQRGPLWWASRHRHHHLHADTPADLHSPHQHSFWYSHAGWFLTPQALATDWQRIPDLAQYPELRWLDRFDLAAPTILALALFGLGEILQHAAPDMGTSGWQLLVWGFFISTTVLFHATVTINSVAHLHGSRRFPTNDGSRNNAWLALITFGEGWHNNHHFYPGSSRQGFVWWEIDLTYYGLRLLAFMRLVRELHVVPAWVLAKRRSRAAKTP